MPIDDNTLALLRHQSARRRYWLAQTPPDRIEAEKCHQRVDDLLDRRPRVHTVSPGGDIVYEDASPWVKAQAGVFDHLPPAETIVKNATGQAEVVARPEDFAEPASIEGMFLSGGGVGVLDRPDENFPRPLTKAEEDEVKRFGREIGL